MTDQEIVNQKLMQIALQARQMSHSPYSGYQVGAALLTKDEIVYTGCNIENAAYSPTNCAERTAFFKAVSEGAREFEAIAIVGGLKDMPENELDFAPPCGVCRQVMAEFCNPETFRVILYSKGELKVLSLSELLPYGFYPINLK